MKVALSSIITLVLFQNTVSQQPPLNDFDVDHSATLSSQELDYINEYIEETGRKKRFVSQAVSSAALGSATAGSRHITNSIGKLIGGASRSISSFSDHSGSGGDSGGHHYGPPPEHHDSSGKLKEAWEIKKIILSSLLQAAKAVNGGLLAIGGKLIKGSGYLIEAKGRFLASKGDVVSDLGKKIVYAAKTQPSSWSSSDHSIEIPVSHHTSSGPGGNYGPPPSHFPSAPSSGYGPPPPSSYHAAEGNFNHYPNRIPHY
ncbi:uncharacterized protein LOC108734744 isoform X2 [Agrilus planipennis]|uniref:Uncharacterized protein LOC108734744 isoform X2 n=1 Tax=Agrilus planipennis TaxID=224129 RepID=A0A1W4WD87_AGRPL|nr:uncharacterized protein LOC108734744 isoform X2 [Agrilus planipennis]